MDENLTEMMAVRTVEKIKLAFGTQINEAIYLLRELNDKKPTTGGASWKSMTGMLIQAVIALLLGFIAVNK